MNMSNDIAVQSQEDCELSVKEGGVEDDALRGYLFTSSHVICHLACRLYVIFEACLELFYVYFELKWIIELYFLH